MVRMIRLIANDSAAWINPLSGDEAWRINAKDESVVNPPANPVIQKRRWYSVVFIR
jgi:hypothetical protein